MRAVLIEVLLAVVVAFCLAFLVIAGSLGFDHLALVGIGLLLLSSLFAAISALGPKYEPTPFLTPMMAGTLTAVIATTLVFAGTARLADDENPLRSASEPAETMQASIDPIEMAPAEPETMEAETMEAETTEDVPMDAPPVRTVEPPREEDEDALAEIIETPVEPAEPPPLIGQPQPPEQTEPEVRLGDPSLEVPPEEDVPLPPTPAPAPAAPASGDGPIRLVEAPPAANAPVANPEAPLPLNPAVGGAGTAPTAPVIPPLPRIRPCGEGGPACR